MSHDSKEVKMMSVGEKKIAKSNTATMLSEGGEQRFAHTHLRPFSIIRFESVNNSAQRVSVWNSYSAGQGKETYGMSDIIEA